MAQTWSCSHADWTLLKKESSLMPHKFTLQDMDNKIRTAQYAVRGAVPARAGELQAKLKAGEKLPFDRLVFCNIGNPHAVGQKPITFYRQVAAAVTDPSLLTAGIYPEDVKKRATDYLAATNNAGSGAYTDSSGLLLVRQQVAEFLLRRDGFPSEPKDIYLTTGASEGVKRAISALIKDERCGMLIPRPQYPLYSAALTMVGGRIVYYDMFEEKGWKTTYEELNQAANDAFTDGTKLRAMTVINPGNPVGAVLDREDVVMLINFATEQKLVILADEVYQENVYREGKQFHSFKKVLRELQKDDPVAYKDTQLISFHSTSKGIIGECGQRGGYMEYVGFSDQVLTQFTKMAATSLSSNTLGQIFVGLMVNPPKPGDPSHELFEKETSAIFQGLTRRALRMTEALNKVPGISSQPIDGAMYAFPSVQLPKKAIEEAKQKEQEPDGLWCLQLLEKTGIVTVPGSGFGQKEGSFHFRTTILPPDELLEEVITKLTTFQEDFMKTYGGGGY
ncbi:Probable alanine aminotransferase [Durusdinium trenchii]|uniref:Mitochondrial (ALT) (Glutamate pyruvate transaminase) (GPT) (Glutamic--alanine transaminase) (Glutamic--pyruvic transaminase) n=1 Tax=Durusdinium trenchii TaxID=1381693 RepID=A0ABP0RRZ5_9DINO